MNFFPSKHLVKLLILCSLPSVALAQAGSKPEARQHFDRGLALAKQKAYAEAIVEFNRAYDISPHFAVLYNLGQAYVAADQPVYAVDALRRYLSEGGGQVPKARRKQVEADLVQQERRIGTVEVRCAVIGASVRIDGAFVGATPLPNPIRLKVGPHAVAASMAGYRPWETRVQVEGRFQKTVEVMLETAAPAPPALLAMVAPAPVPVTPAPIPAAIAPTPAAAPAPVPAQAAPASGSAGQTAPAPAQMAAGEASKDVPGQAASPGADVTTSLPSSPTPAARSGRTAAFIVGGIGVASLVAGGVFGIRAISKRHDSDAECPANQCSAQGVSLNDEARTAAWVSDFTVGAGLICVAVGTYLLLRSPKSETAASTRVASRIQVSPEVGPGQAGLALGGSW